MRHFLYPEQKCRRPSWFQLQSNYGLFACDDSTVLVLYCDKDQIKLDEIESFAFSLFRGVHLISHHHSKHQSGGKTERKSLKEVPDIDVNNSLLGSASFVLIIHQVLLYIQVRSHIATARPISLFVVQCNTVYCQ